MKVFLKQEELQIINGGYVSTVKDSSPVSNPAFIEAQKHAEYIVAFAAAAKGKDFKGKEAVSLSSLKQEVLAKLNASTTINYVELPKEVARPTTDKLSKEAMSFIEFNNKTSKVKKINAFLTKFDIINEFEQFGLFFDDEIVKLNKIYTMEEIVAAVSSTIDLLD